MGVFCAADQRNKVYAAASSFWKLVKQLRQHLRIAERKRWIHCWKWRRKTIYFLRVILNASGSFWFIPMAGPFAPIGGSFVSKIGSGYICNPIDTFIFPHFEVFPKHQIFIKTPDGSAMSNEKVKLPRVSCLSRQPDELSQINGKWTVLVWTRTLTTFYNPLKHLKLVLFANFVMVAVTFFLNIISVIKKLIEEYA